MATPLLFAGLICKKIAFLRDAKAEQYHQIVEIALTSLDLKDKVKKLSNEKESMEKRLIGSHQTIKDSELYLTSPELSTTNLENEIKILESSDSQVANEEKSWGSRFEQKPILNSTLEKIKICKDTIGENQRNVELNKHSVHLAEERIPVLENQIKELDIKIEIEQKKIEKIDEQMTTAYNQFKQGLESPVSS